LVAGLNAAARAFGSPAIILDRASSYLGVMIDDLVLQGITEPYRMLTARAEYRLRLRADNAESRLGPLAEDIGCLGVSRRERLAHRARQRARAETRLDNPISADVLGTRGAVITPDPHPRTGREWLRVAGITIGMVAPDLAAATDSDLLAEIAEDAHYAPYLVRQEAEIAGLRSNDGIAISPAIDFSAIPGLSTEMIERLSAARPATLGAAGRIRGVTPAALTAILLHLRRKAA
jgi:tRNA uridine 5-carboxymethylaminomethyl modification enzyme